MKIELNGNKHEVSEGLTLMELVKGLGFAAERLAIEHNLRIVRRAQWCEVKLEEGDRVEIVHFVGGGCN